jgi:UPF0716 family protein affecting phage T7 exclusion
MFLVYLIIYLFVEVMISSTIAGQIGGLYTFLEIVASAFVGITILKSIPQTAMSNITSIFNGDLSAKEFIKVNLVSAFGAVLIIIPGFFTDMVGILLQFEFFALVVANRLNRPVNNSHFNNTNFNQKKEKDNETIIDVEIIDDKYTINK